MTAIITRVVASEDSVVASSDEGSMDEEIISGLIPCADVAALFE